MSESANILKWKEAAAAVGDPKPLPVPLWVLLGESVDVAAFLEKYWNADTERPGLFSAGEKLKREIGAEILSLHDALNDAEASYLFIVEPQADAKALKQRGAFLLSEITSVLEWFLDDGVETPEDAQLANVEAAHKNDGGAADSLAKALFDFASLAAPLKEKLDGLGDFDAALIDEAFSVSNKLNLLTQTPAARTEEAKAAKLLRDRISNLLYDRVSTVRSAASFVFRNHPKIARLATSAYERKRRAEARRAAAKAKSEKTQATVDL